MWYEICSSADIVESTIYVVRENHSSQGDLELEIEPKAGYSQIQLYRTECENDGSGSWRFYIME